MMTRREMIHNTAANGCGAGRYKHGQKLCADCGSE